MSEDSIYEDYSPRTETIKMTAGSGFSFGAPDEIKPLDSLKAISETIGSFNSKDPVTDTFTFGNKFLGHESFVPYEFQHSQPQYQGGFVFNPANAPLSQKQHQSRRKVKSPTKNNKSPQPSRSPLSTSNSLTDLTKNNNNNNNNNSNEEKKEESIDKLTQDLYTFTLDDVSQEYDVTKTANSYGFVNNYAPNNNNVVGGAFAFGTATNNTFGNNNNNFAQLNGDINIPNNNIPGGGAFTFNQNDNNYGGFANNGSGFANFNTYHNYNNNAILGAGVNGAFGGNPIGRFGGLQYGGGVNFGAPNQLGMQYGGFGANFGDPNQLYLQANNNQHPQPQPQQHLPNYIDPNNPYPNIPSHEKRLKEKEENEKNFDSIRNGVLKLLSVPTQHDINMKKFDLLNKLRKGIIEPIDLNSVNLSDGNIQMLSCLVCSILISPCVMKLVLSNNNISSVTPHVETLTSLISSYKPLKVLNLCDNPLGEELIIPISENLAMSSSLEELNLSHTINFQDIKVVQKLIDSIEESSLQRLKYRKGFFSLLLARNPIGTEEIMETIMSREYLFKFLDLSQINLGLEALSIITEACKRSRTLEKLNISSNNITNAGSHYLADIIRNSPSLLSLDISDNNIIFQSGNEKEDADNQIFIAISQSNHFLKELDISANIILFDDLDSFMGSLWKNMVNTIPIIMIQSYLKFYFELFDLNRRIQNINFEPFQVLIPSIDTNTNTTPINIQVNTIDNITDPSLFTAKKYERNAVYYLSYEHWSRISPHYLFLLNEISYSIFSCKLFDVLPIEVVGLILDFHYLQIYEDILFDSCLGSNKY
jgi:Ran GTPase-activating protein (RanGAP) involved in mRNA processing and transport